LRCRRGRALSRRRPLVWGTSVQSSPQNHLRFALPSAQESLQGTAAAIWLAKVRSLSLFILGELLGSRKDSVTPVRQDIELGAT